jgi:transcription elongation factor Elf1
MGSWTDLSAAVDVYSDWVDACDAVAKEDVEERGGEYAPSRPAGRPIGGRARDDDEDLDDLIDDDDEDGGGGYRGEGIVGDDDREDI